MTELHPAEIRVLGCLLEKQRTTPDVYPLSLNALRLACNQATNRDPVVGYHEEQVREAADRLTRHGLARLASGAGSRAAKYRHLVPERLGLDDARMAVLCVLLLRGPQTPGELRARCERLHPFGSRDEVLAAIGGLCDAGLAHWIPRRPGQKEDRCEHLMGEDATDQAATDPFATGPTAPDPAATGPAATNEAATPDAHRPEPAHGSTSAGPPADVVETMGDLMARVEALERAVEALRRRSAPPEHG